MRSKESEKVKAEILAPAGTEEAFHAAIKAGADAVYLGGNRFGARAYAGNFDDESLLKALDFAHLFKKKVYLTANILIKEQELDDLYSFLLPLYRAGLDAVIVQDAGVVKMIRECFPGMHIHASTQMTVTGRYGAGFLSKYGVDRVVPARELSLEEIRDIRDHSEIEIECFVHGALCYCYSGQCLMSSLAGGRSGNRGRCAQPCRLPYTVYENGKALSDAKTAYALNTKDICTVQLLPELINAGIDSFKIEGRMKRPEYTAGVTAVYRKYRDLALSKDRYTVEKKDLELLADLFNREGFSESYYRQQNGPEMMALHNLKRSARENASTEKAYAFIRENILSAEPKTDLTSDVEIGADSAVMTLEADGVGIRVHSTEVFPAKTAGLTEETVKKQICRTGGTLYRIFPKNIDVSPEAFMSIKALNELRRQGLLAWEEAYLTSFKRNADFTDKETFKSRRISVPGTASGSGSRKRIPISASVSSQAQLEACLGMESIEEIYLGADLFEKTDREYLNAGKKISLCLPSPLRFADSKGYGRLIEIAREAKAGFLAGSLEELAFLLETAAPEQIRLDAGLYMMNPESRLFARHFGITKDTVPYELNRTEILHRDNGDSELVIYGRLPLMISAQCLKKNYDRCTKNGARLTLKDRKNFEYPVFCDCLSCRNIIYNPFPLSLLSKKKEVMGLNPGSVRFAFTDEDPGRIRELVNGWTSDQPYKEDFEFTRGHFGRGV